MTTFSTTSEEHFFSEAEANRRGLHVIDVSEQDATVADDQSPIDALLDRPVPGYRWGYVKRLREAQRRTPYDETQFPLTVATFCEHFGSDALLAILLGKRPPRSVFTQLAAHAPAGSRLEAALVLLAAKSPETWLRLLSEGAPGAHRRRAPRRVARSDARRARRRAGRDRSR